MAYLLIVDDDEDFAEGLGDVFELHGHECELAFNGEEAVDRFKEKDFDIAFMDVKLPGKNGVESYLEIRKSKPHAKVVIMTGYSVEQLLDQAMDNGAWGILHKPLDMEKVLEMIAQIRSGGILIADDDQDFVKNLREILENAGFMVYIAHDGQEALERVREDDVDILVLDLRMPILSGLDTYLELKNAGYNVPTVIVTAYASEEIHSIDTLRSLEVEGILNKPFDPNELIAILEHLLEET